jgi:hypothetical protein
VPPGALGSDYEGEKYVLGVFGIGGTAMTKWVYIGLFAVITAQLQALLAMGMMA